MNSPSYLNPVDSNPGNNFTFNSVQPPDLGQMIPIGIQQQALLSPTSNALDCFVGRANGNYSGQQFSIKLQIYMINYVMATSSLYPLYA